MKLFEGNEELAKILMQQGLVEITSEDDKIRKKRKFNLLKNRNRQIFFDDSSICLMDDVSLQDRRIGLNKEELKLCILFFKLSSIDLKELCPSGVFNINKVSQRLYKLEDELKLLIKFNKNEFRKAKIERIFETLKGIKI